MRAREVGLVDRSAVGRRLTHRYSSIMLAVALSVISAVALGLVTEAVTGAISKGFYKIRSRVDSLRSLGYDVRQDGLYCLGDWSPARKLQPSRLITEMTPEKSRPRQPYIDRRVLANAVRKHSRQASGATLYMTGFRIDHRESDETQHCRVRQVASTYPEVLAIEHLRIRRPDLFDECDKAIEQDVRAYLDAAVPSSP